MSNVALGGAIQRYRLPTESNLTLAGSWHGDNYGSFSGTTGIPFAAVFNEASTTCSLKNIMQIKMPPRRVILNWQSAGQTAFADNVMSSHDGEVGGASTITINSTSAAWRLYDNMPNGYIDSSAQITLAVWGLLASGPVGLFKMGQPFSPAWSSSFALTTSWQRFAHTTSVNTGPTTLFFGLGSDTNTSSFTMALSDFQIYLGSSDLGASDPLAGHFMTGSSSVPVNGLVDFSTGATGNIAQLLNPISYGEGFPMTLLCCVERVPATGGQEVDDFAQTYMGELGQDSFQIGPAPDQKYPGFRMGFAALAPDQNREQTFTGGTTSAEGEPLWDYTNHGFAVHAFVWDGTSHFAYINGKPLLTTVPALSPPPVVNGLSNLNWSQLFEFDHQNPSRYSSLVFYQSALTPAQVKRATMYLRARHVKNGNPFPNTKWIILVGDDSISNGWGYLLGKSVTVPVRGAGFGYTGALYTDAAITTILNNQLFPLRQQALPAEEVIAIVYLGRNSLGTGAATATAAGVAAIHDTIRARGVKTIACTLHDSSFTGNQTQFNTDRAAFNTIVRTWTGVHCDALFDIAALSNVGPNSSIANATYFNAGNNGLLTDTGNLYVASSAAPVVDSI